MPRPITIRTAGPAESAAVWQLAVEACRPDRERLHPPSGVFRETVQEDGEGDGNAWRPARMPA